MIDYTVTDREGNKQTYVLSYQELKEKHYELCTITDAEFMRRLPEALHLACIIAWLKEIPSYVCLSDRGIIHELAHLLHLPETEYTPREVMYVRQGFEQDLKLA